MWVWREETVRGGWRLDSTGSWTYDEPARLERVGSPRGPRDPEPDRLARERAVRAQRARTEGRRPALASVPPRSDFEATPIFRSVAHEVREWRDERRDDRYPEPRREDQRRQELRREELRREERRREDRRRAEASIPEPHPGSGPFPAQARTRRGLAPVESVPPPAREGDGPVGSAEDELRRRAERRRRPRVEPESGRHALRP